MEKVVLKTGTMIYPLPAVLVSCGTNPDEYNIITISWTGTICSEPPMCYISVRKSRHSYEIIKRNMEFTINLTNSKLAFATDWCGVMSGKKKNKFTEMNLTIQDGLVIKTPSILESPISIECKVSHIIPLGSHDMFIANVVAITGDKTLIDPTTGKFNLSQSELMHYSHGNYFEQGALIDSFGFSVKNKD